MTARNAAAIAALTVLVLVAAALIALLSTDPELVAGRNWSGLST